MQKAGSIASEMSSPMGKIKDGARIMNEGMKK